MEKRLRKNQKSYIILYNRDSNRKSSERANPSSTNLFRGNSDKLSHALGDTQPKATLRQVAFRFLCISTTLISNTMETKTNNRDLFLLGLTILGFSEKDWEGEKAIDEEGATFTREELIEIGEQYENWGND